MSSSHADKKLVAVHRCTKCGSTFLPAELNADAGATGLFICPSCGNTGPLQIDIVPSEDVSHARNGS